MHPDDAAAIANELYRYAELIDAGRFNLPAEVNPAASKEQ